MSAAPAGIDVEANVATAASAAGEVGVTEMQVSDPADGDDEDETTQQTSRKRKADETNVDADTNLEGDGEENDDEDTFPIRRKQSRKKKNRNSQFMDDTAVVNEDDDDQFDYDYSRDGQRRGRHKIRTDAAPKGMHHKHTILMDGPLFAFWTLASLGEAPIGSSSFVGAASSSPVTFASSSSTSSSLVDTKPSTIASNLVRFHLADQAPSNEPPKLNWNQGIHSLFSKNRTRTSVTTTTTTIKAAADTQRTTTSKATIKPHVKPTQPSNRNRRPCLLMKRLVKVELQSVMLFLSLKSVCQFARCSKYLLQLARDRFALKYQPAFPVNSLDLVLNTKIPGYLKHINKNSLIAYLPHGVELQVTDVGLTYDLTELRRSMRRLLIQVTRESQIPNIQTVRFNHGTIDLNDLHTILTNLIDHPITTLVFTRMTTRLIPQSCKEFIPLLESMSMLRTLVWDGPHDLPPLPELTQLLIMIPLGVSRGSSTMDHILTSYDSLTSLTLVRPYLCTNDDYVQFFTSPLIRQLQYLRLKYMDLNQFEPEFISDLTLELVCESLIKLKYLSLDSITGVERLFNYLHLIPSLVQLIITGGSYVSGSDHTDVDTLPDMHDILNFLRVKPSIELLIRPTKFYDPTLPDDPHLTRNDRQLWKKWCRTQTRDPMVHHDAPTPITFNYSLISISVPQPRLSALDFALFMDELELEQPSMTTIASRIPRFVRLHRNRSSRVNWY